MPASSPPWKLPESGYSTEEQPIVVFYSFKGGVGRSTALAAFAIQRARAGERIAVIDADLDAPGLGHLLSAPEVGTAQWGVADYL
ncbi:MAG: ParA family protein, partial [Planctomycetota bacterium]